MNATTDPHGVTNVFAITSFYSVPPQSRPEAVEDRRSLKGLVRRSYRRGVKRSRCDVTESKSWIAKEAPFRIPISRCSIRHKTYLNRMQGGPFAA